MTKPSAELAALFEPVLEWLDKGGDRNYRFNMRGFYHQSRCGTSCCIAGALGVFNKDLNLEGVSQFNDSEMSRASRAEHALVRNYGMDEDDAFELFFGDLEAGPAQAARVVRHWIETGEVDWSQ